MSRFALAVGVGLLSACHLLIQHSPARDGEVPAVDRAVVPAVDRAVVPAVDRAVGQERAPGVDAAPPDLASPTDVRGAEPRPADLPQPKPDTRPVYVNEDFVSGPGVLKTLTGTWTPGGGSLRQPSTGFNGTCVTAPVPVANYVAETEITVHSVLGVTNWAEGAGVGVRVQPNPILPNPPGQYVCGISPDEGLLMIAKCPGGASNNCMRQKQTPATLPYGTPVVVRATITGSTFTCALPAKGVSLTWSDPSYTSGGVALITFYADASFAYLKVYAP